MLAQKKETYTNDSSIQSIPVTATQTNRIHPARKLLFQRELSANACALRGILYGARCTWFMHSEANTVENNSRYNTVSGMVPYRNAETSVHQSRPRHMVNILSFIRHELSLERNVSASIIIITSGAHSSNRCICHAHWIMHFVAMFRSSLYACTKSEHLVSISSRRVRITRASV